LKRPYPWVLRMAALGLIRVRAKVGVTVGEGRVSPDVPS